MFCFSESCRTLSLLIPQTLIICELSMTSTKFIKFYHTNSEVIKQLKGVVLIDTWNDKELRKTNNRIHLVQFSYEFEAVQLGPSKMFHFLIFAVLVFVFSISNTSSAKIIHKYVENRVTKLENLQSRDVSMCKNLLNSMKNSNINCVWIRPANKYNRYFLEFLRHKTWVFSVGNNNCKYFHRRTI